MKKGILITGFTLLLLMALVNDLFTHVGGAASQYSGGASEKNCTWCHSGTVNSGTGSASITSDAPMSVYTPGDTYTFTVTVTQSSIVRFGFEVLTGYSASVNKSIGTQIITNSTHTQQKATSTRKYVTHRLAGTTGTTGSHAWNFDWVAPAAGSGDVVFYLAGNATNNLGTSAGDKVYTTSLTITEFPVAITSPQTLPLELTVYPTVVEQEVNVDLNNVPLHPVSIAVMDMEGKSIWQGEYLPSGFHVTRTLDASNWTPGVYFLQVSCGEYREVRKLIRL